jgi:hypothetical protein
MIMLKLGSGWRFNLSASSLNGFYLSIDLVISAVFAYFSAGKSSQAAAVLDAET